MVNRVGVTSSRDETSRLLAAWLRQPRTPLSTRRAQPLVLFLCRSNGTLSIMAEAMLRHLAQERMRSASAGDSAAARVSPYALECLCTHGIETKGLRSKAWGEFFGPNRPPVRFLIALCDVCATATNWGHDTLIAQWKMPDPAIVVGSEIDIRVAFEEAYGTLDSRIRQFLALPLGNLNAPALAQELQRIGEAS